MDEREFELVNIVGAELAANQRELSRRMNLSLGLTNMLLKRLVTKGYIRIKQLDRRKVRYMLTPKGFAEKMHKSVKYTRKTINSIALVRSGISAILKKFYSEGIKTFYILGSEDLAGLIEMTMQEEFPAQVKVLRINEMPALIEEGIVLVCCEGVDLTGAKVRALDVIQELAKNETLINQYE